MSNKPDIGSATELELDWGNREQRAPSPTDAITPATPTEDEVEPSGAGKGAPGDPRYMSMALRMPLAPLLEAPALRMKQFRERLELLIPWDVRNQYEICDETGRPALYASEVGEGLKSALMRNFWPFYKRRMDCMTVNGILALTVERPWTLLFARADVTAWDGRLLGHVRQRFTLLSRKLELETPAGVVLASVEGPWWRPWTFRVMQRGVEVATIRKQWSGLLQEAMGSADNFGLEFTPQCTDGRLRQLIVAAALLVDLTYFEKKGGGGGSLLGMLPE